MTRKWVWAAAILGAGCSDQPTLSTQASSARDAEASDRNDTVSPDVAARSTPLVDPEVSRRWTWQECGTIPSNPGVRRAKYAPDGQSVAIQSEDGSIVLKAPDRLAPARVTLQGFGGEFVFSSDGSRIAETAGQIAVSQTSDGARVGQLPSTAGLDCGFARVALSDHGDDVLTYGSGPLCVWHVADGELTARLPETALDTSSKIVSAAFLAVSGAASRIVVARARDTVFDVRIHDLQGQELSRAALALADPAAAIINGGVGPNVVVSPTGETIAGWVSTPDGKVAATVWDPRDGRSLFRKEKASTNSAAQVVFSSDGRVVALDDGVFDTAGFGRLGDAPSQSIDQPSLSPRGDSMAWAPSGYAGLYETASKHTRVLTNNPASNGSRSIVSSLDLTQDGRTLLSGARGAIAWTLTDPLVDSAPTWVGGIPEAGTVHVSPDGHFATIAGDGRVLFDLESGAVNSFDAPPPALAANSCVWLGLRFSPDNHWVAGPGYGDFANVYDLHDAKWTNAIPTKGCNAKIVFSSDSRRMYTARGEVFDTGDWLPIASATSEETLGPIDDVEISPQGELLTSTCKDPGTNVSCITRLAGHPLTDLTSPHPKFSSEGNWIVAGGTLLHFPSHEARVFDKDGSVAIFAPNGDILSGRRDGSLARYCRSEGPSAD